MTPYPEIQSRKRQRRADIAYAAFCFLLGAAALAVFQWLGI